MPKKGLYKTNIIIWTDYDPFAQLPDLETLAREATSGDALCSKQETVFIDDIEKDDDWGGNEDFFWDPEDEE